MRLGGVGTVCVEETVGWCCGPGEQCSLMGWRKKIHHRSLRKKCQWEEPEERGRYRSKQRKARVWRRERPARRNASEKARKLNSKLGVVLAREVQWAQGQGGEIPGLIGREHPWTMAAGWVSWVVPGTAVDGATHSSKEHRGGGEETAVCGDSWWLWGSTGLEMPWVSVTFPRQCWISSLTYNLELREEV